MLEETYQAFENHFKNKEKSWECFLEFIVVDNNVGFLWEMRNMFNWLFKNKSLAKSISEVYKSELLKSNKYDYLGDMYRDRFLNKEHPRWYDISSLYESNHGLISQMKKSKSNGTIAILDPEAGTGRLLMEAKRKEPSAILYGVENDLNLYRIAIANFSIYNINGFLLNADPQLYEIDISKDDGKYNWLLSNRWNSCKNILKPLPTFRTSSNYTYPTK